MEILNAIMLLFASFVIFFLVFFINFLQKMLKTEQEQKLEILLYFSKNYEKLFKRCLKTEREIVILKKDIFFLKDNYIPKCPEYTLKKEYLWNNAKLKMWKAWLWE